MQLLWAVPYILPHRAPMITLIVGSAIASASAVQAALGLTSTLWCVGALTWCRYLHSNQLTGSLPAAWSALASLQQMWVPCSLLAPLISWCRAI